MIPHMAVFILKVVITKVCYGIYTSGDGKIPSFASFSCNLPQFQRRRRVFPGEFPMAFRSLLPTLAALVLLTGPSCTGWPRGWGKAKRLATTDGLSGAWQGTWESVPTGHTGKLRCAVFPKSPGVWEYRYRATWARVLCAGFSVDCQGTRQADGSWRVTGERDLGPLFGGKFSHEGTITGDQLNAQYRAAADHGNLTLRRVASE
jgi:hypothetical protein